MADGVIDVHSHFLPPVWRGMVAKRQGGADGMPQILGRPAPDWSAEAHLAMMEREGIALAMLSWPTATEGLAEQPAIVLARLMNEILAGLVERYPTRFGAFAVLPLTSPDALVAESVHALDILGLDGVACTPQIAGHYLGQPCYDDWFAELDRRAAVLFVHPSIPPGGDRLHSVLHPALLEFMFDTTRAIGNLMFSGCLRRFPGIRLVCTHGGAAAPYLVNRMAVLSPTIGHLFGGLRLSPDDVLASLGSFYFDLTASAASTQVDTLLRLVGAERLLLGFDYPMMPEATIAPALDTLWSNAGVGPAARAAIAQDNALTLLPGVARRLAAS